MVQLNKLHHIFMLLVLCILLYFLEFYIGYVFLIVVRLSTGLRSRLGTCSGSLLGVVDVL